MCPTPFGINERFALTRGERFQKLEAQHAVQAGRKLRDVRPASPRNARSGPEVLRPCLPELGISAPSSATPAVSGIGMAVVVLFIVAVGGFVFRRVKRQAVAA